MEHEENCVNLNERRWGRQGRRKERKEVRKHKIIPMGRTQRPGLNLVTHGDYMKHHQEWMDQPVSSTRKADHPNCIK